jgi:hypothetical protein
VAQTGPDRRAVPAAGGALAADEEIDEIVERMRLAAVSNVDDALLAQLDMTVESIGHRYEASDAAAVYPAALAHRRTVQQLITGQQHPRQHTHLYTLAGKLSGLLGYLAFDLGNDRVARAYCNEAFSLATAAGSNPLAAVSRALAAHAKVDDADPVGVFLSFEPSAPHASPATPPAPTSPSAPTTRPANSPSRRSPSSPPATRPPATPSPSST